MIPIEEYRTWFRLRVTDPEPKQIAATALDAYERTVTVSVGAVAADNLASVMVAATNRSRAVWDLGVDLLLRLAVQFVDAQEAVRNLMCSRKFDHRLRVIASLRPGPSFELLTELILLGLDDPRFRVR